MFRSISDIDLFQFQTIQDFLNHSFLSIEQLKQLFDDNHEQFPLTNQIEQFVLDHILSSIKHETFRDESILDLYTSILNDLLHWINYTHKQIICILTLIQGLLCQIEKHDELKLNQAFIHACSILMNNENDQKKIVLFNVQQYPKVIDYIIQTIFQHQHLYEILLEEKPQNIENIQENRSIDFHIFEKSLFPYPLTEALPLSIYREIILQIPPTPRLLPDQLSNESLSIITTTTTTIANEEINNIDLNMMINNLHHQYPNITFEQIQQIFAEVSQEYLSEYKLREKELSLLKKFNHLQLTNKNE